MTNLLTVKNVQQPRLQLPAGYTLASVDTRSRNWEVVRVERYQDEDQFRPNQPHVTLVWGSDDRLISFNDFSVDNTEALPKRREAVKIAEETMETLDPKYARGLSYMRTDRLSRYYELKNGNHVIIPVLWVKFAHANGSYNWVSVGAGGQVVEVERESLWDYGRARRATEEWNYDDWVQAFEGNGPQPAAPEALA